jgi:hypothetical protein
MIKLFLQTIQKAYSKNNLTKLEILLNQLIKISPIPTIPIEKGLIIERIRNNYKGEIFYSESELSFRTDPWNVKEFGRANLPNSSRFYGSIKSNYIDEIRIVNVMETNKAFRENKRIKKTQVFTSGQWITNTDLKAAIFPFYKSAIIYNEEVKFHALKFESIIDKFSKEQKSTYKSILNFISYHYGLKTINNHLDYACSALISELLFINEDFDAILYPSVRANYTTYNLVLEPHVVMDKLSFINAAMFELFLDGRKAFIDNIAYAQINRENKIFWNFTERATNAEIKKYLK